MARRSWLLSWVLVATLPALAVVPCPQAHADGGWWGDLDKGMNVRLADVLESPERYRGRALTFACVFHQAEREFNPLRTRFNAERYDNVSVWPDGAPLWKKAAFERDFPFVYIARTHPQRDLLVRQDLFTRLELTARIEAVVDGSPFLEVTGVKVTGHKLGREVMNPMLRGEVHGQTAGVEAQTLAAQNFQAALDAVPDLAPPYAAAIRERLAEALVNLGRTEEAQRLIGSGALPAVPAAAAPGFPAPAEAAFPAPSSPVPAPLGDGSELPRGGSLPGQPIGQETGSVPLLGSPDGDAPPATQAVPPRPRMTPPPTRPLQPLAPPALSSPNLPSPTLPDGSMRPSLPGIPVDNVPVRPGTAPGAAVSATAASGAPLPAARVVDPPLPAPAPGQGAPPRRPRLSGVK